VQDFKSKNSHVLKAESLVAVTWEGRFTVIVGVHFGFSVSGGVVGGRDSVCRRTCPHRAGEGIGVGDRRSHDWVANFLRRERRCLEWSSGGRRYNRESLGDHRGVCHWTARINCGLWAIS